jgi:hypothetical protein
MTSENKPTPGAWFTNRDGFSTVYVEARICGGWLQEVAACGPTEQGPEQQEANARLIAEAGTVHHECGLSPRELLEAVRDMYMELREIAQYPENDTVEMRRIARAALAKHKEV